MFEQIFPILATVIGGGALAVLSWVAKTLHGIPAALVKLTATQEDHGRRLLVLEEALPGVNDVKTNVAILMERSSNTRDSVVRIEGTLRAALDPPSLKTGSRIRRGATG